MPAPINAYDTHLLGNPPTPVTSQPGLFGSLSYLHSFTSHILAGLDVDYNSGNIEMSTGNNVYTSGNVLFNAGQSITVSIFPMVRFQTIPEDGFQFYGSLGIGANLNYADTSAGWNWNCSPVAHCAGMGFQNSFGMRVAIGVDYWVSEHIGIDLETGYLYDPTTLTNTVTALSQSTGTSANLSTIFILGGLHFGWNKGDDR